MAVPLAEPILVERRVPPPGNPNTNNIIVRFVSRNKKNNVQNKARKARLMIRGLGLNNDTFPWFFKDHLSQRSHFPESIESKDRSERS